VAPGERGGGDVGGIGAGRRASGRCVCGVVVRHWNRRTRARGAAAAVLGAGERARIRDAVARWRALAVRARPPMGTRRPDRRRRATDAGHRTVEPTNHL